MTEGDPAADFRAPLILHAGGRSAIAMMRDTVLTTLLWLGWALLFFATIGYFWVPPFAQELIPVALPEDRGQVLRLGALCLLLALAICLLLLLRMRIDRWRFRGTDRRRSLPPPDEEALAKDFKVQPAQIKLWANARRLVIHHDDAGDIQRVDIMEGLTHDIRLGTAADLFRGTPSRQG